MVLSWRAISQRLRTVLHSDDAPWKIALAMAIGVFFSCTPLYGLHTLLVVGAAILLRLNKVAAVTGAWLNLPWFAPFVYGLSLKVGEFILSGGTGLEGVRGRALGDLAGTIGPSLSIERFSEGFLASSKFLFLAWKPLFVGTVVVGIVAGLITYFVILGAIRKIRSMRYVGPVRDSRLRG